MLLFYSGAKQANGAQPYSWLSLGSYPSISQIKNGVKNSIFNDVTLNDVKQQITIYRLIVLKNTTSNQVTNINVYVEKANGCICKFEGALVEPAIDPCNDKVFETIQNETDIPISATFTNCETNLNPLVIASLNAGDMIGIWLKKIIDNNNSNYFTAGKFNINTCDLLFNALNDSNNFYNNKIDEFSIKIAY